MKIYDRRISSAKEMNDLSRAWTTLYGTAINAVAMGTLETDGDPIFAQHGCRIVRWGAQSLWVECDGQDVRVKWGGGVMVHVIPCL